MPLRTAQPVKVVGSTKNYQWDFTSDLAVGETLVAASVTMTVYSGSDPAPQTMVSGNASIAGNIVTQLLTKIGRAHV